MTTPENEIFNKIKEISARAFNPRPSININHIATELSISNTVLTPALARLRQLKLISYSDLTSATIKLTLLGSVVTK